MAYYKKPTRKVIEGAGGQEYTVSKKKRVMHEESKVQRPLVGILAKIEAYTKKLTYFHVPNQLLRRSDLKKIFSGLGVRSGVPDLVVPIEGGKTLFIECKYNGNGASDDQSAYMEGLKRLGHIVYVIDAKDSHDAQNQLFAILEEHGITDFRLKV